jgi:hypothetical protein
MITHAEWCQTVRDARNILWMLPDGRRMRLIVWLMQTRLCWALWRVTAGAQ